jgi:DNA-directed RNA polymerase beta subunit
MCDKAKPLYEIGLREWRYCGQIQTPELPKIGMVKNMAITPNITKNVSTLIIEKYLKEQIIITELVDKNNMHAHIKVFINGNWIGITNDIYKIRSDLIKMKISNEIKESMSLIFEGDTNDFHIFIIK